VFLAFRKLIGAGAMLLFALTALISFHPAQAATNERCFAETSYCISGPIRTYWERNGGLAVFGYPITALRTETVEQSWEGPVQWFQRDRLEDHSADGQGVLAGRLGDSALQLQGINWRTLPGDGSVMAGCRFFRETQFNVCEPFLSYWQANGGLERFGYPLTRARQETLEGREYTVQYFERRRMELHPENAGTPYAVLLGLLGRDVYAVEGDQNVVVLAPGDVWASIQQPILDAAYASLRASGQRVKLAIGLIEVNGDNAVVLARPFGQDAVTIALTRRGNSWKVVPATNRPGGDTFAVIDLALAQLQDPRGTGLNIYVTQPRVAGNYARMTAAPSLAENLDGATMFFKRVNGAWRFLTAGTAFPEDNLRELGVPQELWLYGESVHGPAK
jgi:hypothetical protein